MANTDLEMRNITQVAYADFSKAYDYLTSVNPEASSFTIRDLVNVTKILDSNADISSISCLTDDQLKNWRISCVYDSNSTTGFYACVVETSPGNAVVGFRGSESLGNPNALITDWYGGDIDLLNSTQTIQHLEAEKFLNQYKSQLSSYENLAFTGHSLGGNLAEYSAIVSYKYGLDDALDSCISFDGPGFSNEFLALNRKHIKNMNNKMVHYRWSLIGSLLYDLPGVTYKTCSVSNESNEKDNQEFNFLTRHDTKYLDFDESGNVIQGENDIAILSASAFTKLVDGLPSWYGNSAKYAILPLIFVVAGGEMIWEKIKEAFNVDVTVYKDVVAIFKNLFIGNKKYLRVNTSQLNSDINTINSLLKKISSNVSGIFNDVIGLNGMWTGSANNAFCAKFASEQKRINNYLKDISKYVEILDNDRNTYIRCENRITDIVHSIMV